MIYSLHITKNDIRRLPLIFTLLGLQHPQEPVVRPGGMRTWQYFFCVQGQGEFLINGKRTILSPGDGLLLPPDTPHSYHALAENWVLNFVGFSGNNTAGILKTLRMSEAGICRYKGPDLFGAFSSEVIEADHLKAGARTEKLSCLCYEFLLRLSRGIRFINDYSAASENPVVVSMISYMEEHYAENFQLDDLAHEVSFSKGYIQALFKKEMGCSVVKQLQSIRISHARIMLTEDPERKVSEIAKACGFESPSYFGLVFKRETGKTPEEYRKG